MTPHEEKFFEDARTLFLTEGWKDFIKEVENMFNSVTLESCSSSDDFWQSKGARNALSHILAYETMVVNAEASAEEEDHAEDF